MRPQFFVTKIAGKGTSNIIVARIFLQNERLLKSVVDIDTTAKEEVVATLFECKKDLLQLEEYKDKYIALEDDWVKQWKKKENIRVEPNAVHFEEIIGIEEIVKNFLIWGVICLRHLPKLLSPLFGVTVDSLQKSKKYFESKLPQGHPFLKMLDEDSEWVKELYGLRAEAEHKTLKVQNIKLQWVNNKLQAVAPNIPEHGAVRQYLDVTLHNVFTFCEEFVVNCLIEKMIPMVTVREIPENERDPSCPIRFVETLKPEYLKRLQKEN